jgi:hypothetical protein
MEDEFHKYCSGGGVCAIENCTNEDEDEARKGGDNWASTIFICSCCDDGFDEEEDEDDDEADAGR